MPKSRTDVTGSTVTPSMNVLRPPDEIRSKPSMHVAVDAEGMLQRLQQNGMIDGVEGCRSVKEN